MLGVIGRARPLVLGMTPCHLQIVPTGVDQRRKPDSPR